MHRLRLAVIVLAVLAVAVFGAYRFYFAAPSAPAWKLAAI